MGNREEIDRKEAVSLKQLQKERDAISSLVKFDRDGILPDWVSVSYDRYALHKK